MTKPVSDRASEAISISPGVAMWRAWAVLLLATIVTLVMWRLSESQSEHDLRAEFDVQVAEIRTKLNTNVRAYSQVLRGAAALFKTGSSVTRQDWHSYVSSLRLEQDYPAIQAIAFARFVDAASLDGLVREARLSGVKAFSIRPPGRRDHYAVNVFTEPFEGLNIKALGYDMWQDADRRLTMERASDTGEAMVTQRITLRVDEDSNPVPAFIMYVPVFVEDRRELFGYVLSPFRMPVLMQDLLRGGRGGISVSIYDGPDSRPENLFYSSHPKQADQQTRLVETESLSIGGRTWTVNYAALPYFEALRNDNRPFLTLAGGLIISLLLFGITLSLASTQRRAVRLAQELTRTGRESEERFRMLVESAPYGIALVNADDSIAHVNKAFTRLFGYTREDVPTLESWRQRAYPDPAYRREVEQSWRQEVVAVGMVEEVRRTFKVRRLDGDERIVEFIVVPLSGQRRLMTLGDITDRTLMEETVAEEQRKYRALFDSANDGIFLIDRNGYVDCNRQGARMYGVSVADIIGQTPLDFSPLRQPDGRLSRELAAEMGRAVAAGTPLRFDWQCLRPDGSVFDVEITLSRIRYEGKPFAQAILRDITERKRADLALRASEARFRSLTHLGADWYWEQDREFRFTEVSGPKPAERMPHGIDTIGRKRWELNYLETDEGFWRAHRDVLERHEAFRGFEVSRLDHRGEVRYVSLSGEPKFDEAGKFAGYRGIGRDITERVQAIESLNIASTVYENSSEAMAVTDTDNRIIAVNPAFERTTGYTAAEVVGKNPRLLKSGKHDDDFYRAMWQALDDGGHWQGEIWNRRKNGELYLEQLTINTTYAQDGSVHRRVALFSDITKRKQAEELIWTQANFDALTELPNRRMFHDRLAQEIKKAHRANQQLALLFIDLDNFKEINDTLGHNMGDLLLIEAGRRITACVRETDTVARLGGDEFTVLLTELEDAGNIERVASNILKMLEAPFALGDQVMIVSASIGITLYPGDATDIEELLKSADQAMYVAKRLGRNRFSYFTPALQEAAQARLKLINDLRGAVSGGQLRVYFQPILELASGRIHKAEALVRWLHPQRGLVSPAEFIKVAEETGLIFEIGDWVFKEAAHWAQRWRGLHDEAFQVSVNKSPVQFYQNNGHDAWLSNLSDIGLAGAGIVIEITEGMLLNSDAPIMNSLYSYRDSGIQVAVDDFGTGYSSLSYLKKFDIDYLKIDQSFIRNLTPGSSDMALSEAIIVMAHKLGLKVIAEGVETEAQRELLTAAGCDYAQGYLFSRPVPPEEFELQLNAHG